ncbi:MAG TPA: hypothetical protein VGP68_02195 [Gemmataceae bacterium]|jgi:hypothetical protein|nr:hypothetical protein [Gemmataceae bacterium]
MTRQTQTLTAGPLGFPVTDEQAKAIEAILHTNSKDSAFAYKKLVVAKAQSEVLPGERSDVSWISTEEPDRTREVVIAAGLNDEQFKLNPIVTMNHCYHVPPVGKSLWRKKAKDGDVRGIKAKTQYPAKPTNWPADSDWAPDIAFALVQADMLRGKSIGFLPIKGFSPDAKTCDTNGWTKVDWVVEEWMLLEYACTFLPTQQQAVVEAVSKSFGQIPETLAKAFDLKALEKAVKAAPEKPLHKIGSFTPIEEIAKSLARQIESLDLNGLVRNSIDLAFHKARGGV